MTLEQIVEAPADLLESISDEQYKKWFEEQKFFDVTRPERAAVTRQQGSSHSSYKPLVDKAMDEKIKAAKQLGIEGLDFLYSMKKKPKG